MDPGCFKKSESMPPKGHILIWLFAGVGAGAGEIVDPKVSKA